MFLVRPAISKGLKLEGSMKEGPWSYRVATFVVMFPVYPFLLLTFGTIFNRHIYFRHFAVKMLSRFGIPKGRIDPWYRGKSPEEVKVYEKSIRKW